MAESDSFLPLMVDFAGRRVLIFGGGGVGGRKAMRFCEVADTLVVSSSFNEKLLTLANEDKISLLKIESGSLDDSELDRLISTAFLVIPATSDCDLNRRISEIANEKGLFLNQVDVDRQEITGNVMLPSMIRRGDLLISISTGGISPAISKYTRMKIEETITPDFSLMIKLQDEIRDHLKKNISDQKIRQKILWEIIDDREIWSNLSGSFEEAKEKAMSVVDRFI